MQRAAGHPQDSDPKHQTDPNLLLHLHLERPHLSSRQVKHPEVQADVDGRMGPCEGVDVEAAAAVFAVPGLPEEAYRLALQEVASDEAPDQEQVENLRGPYDTAELRVREESEVQKQDRRLDQPEGQRVEHFKDEEDLEKLEDAPGLESPDVPAQTVSFFEDAPSEPASSKQLWTSVIVSVFHLFRCLLETKRWWWFTNPGHHNRRIVVAPRC